MLFSDSLAFTQASLIGCIPCRTKAAAVFTRLFDVRILSPIPAILATADLTGDSLCHAAARAQAA